MKVVGDDIYINPIPLPEEMKEKYLVFIFKIFKESIWALISLDRVGIAHRDLKLDNLMIQLGPEPFDSSMLNNPDFITSVLELKTSFKLMIIDIGSGKNVQILLSQTEKWGNPLFMSPEV